MTSNLSAIPLEAEEDLEDLDRPDVCKDKSYKVTYDRFY